MCQTTARSSLCICCVFVQMVEILTSEINSIYVSLEIPRLTFDPVALVEVDLPLSLGCIRTNHYEVSSWNCTVQLPSGSNCLSTTAGAGRKKKMFYMKWV